LAGQGAGQGTRRRRLAARNHFRLNQFGLELSGPGPGFGKTGTNFFRSSSSRPLFHTHKMCLIYLLLA
jgi:hypothetical protein